MSGVLLPSPLENQIVSRNAFSLVCHFLFPPSHGSTHSLGLLHCTNADRTLLRSRSDDRDLSRPDGLQRGKPPRRILRVPQQHRGRRRRRRRWHSEGPASPGRGAEGDQRQERRRRRRRRRAHSSGSGGHEEAGSLPAGGARGHHRVDAQREEVLAQKQEEVSGETKRQDRRREQESVEHFLPSFLSLLSAWCTRNQNSIFLSPFFFSPSIVKIVCAFPEGGATLRSKSFSEGGGLSRRRGGVKQRCIHYYSFKPLCLRGVKFLPAAPETEARLGWLEAGPTPPTNPNGLFQSSSLPLFLPAATTKNFVDSASFLPCCPGDDASRLKVHSEMGDFLRGIEGERERERQRIPSEIYDATGKYYCCYTCK